jgi:DsbC/DsbD-like thiol-disulfide interchange protein
MLSFQEMRIANRELRAPLILVAAVILAGCGPNRPMADAPQTHHAQVELLADPASLTIEGRPRWLGVHFKLDPGWHIYWQNPGDSGQPPVINWNLPAGATALPIQWPRPQRLNSTGASLMDYGYKDDVLLPVPVNFPADSKSAAEAEAKYLICREVCIAEKSDLRLALPAADDARTAELFARARNRLPRMLPPGWKATAVEGQDDFILSVTSVPSRAGDIGNPLEKADFFPLEPQQIENAAPQRLRLTSRGATITLKKSDQLAKTPAALRGVLVLGNGEAYRIEAPVTPR